MSRKITIQNCKFTSTSYRLRIDQWAKMESRKFTTFFVNKNYNKCCKFTRIFFTVVLHWLGVALKHFGTIHLKLIGETSFDNFCCTTWSIFSVCVHVDLLFRFPVPRSARYLGATRLQVQIWIRSRLPPLRRRLACSARSVAQSELLFVWLSVGCCQCVFCCRPCVHWDYFRFPHFRTSGLQSWICTLAGRFSVLIRWHPPF